MRTSKNCEYCLRSFTPKSERAKFCSNSCKTKAHNARKNNQTPIGNPPRAGVQVHHYPELDERFKSVQQLQREIQHEKEIIQLREQRIEQLHQTTQRKVERANKANNLTFTERTIIGEGVSTLAHLIKQGAKSNTLHNTLNDNSFSSFSYSYFQSDLRIIATILGAGIGFLAMKGKDTEDKIASALVGGGLGWIAGLLANKIVTPQLTTTPMQQTHQIEQQPTKQHKYELVSANNLHDMIFDTYQFSGRLQELIGNPQRNFFMSITGAPKQGKSHLSTQLARELSKHGKVLYIAAEEGLSQNLKERFIRSGATSSNISIVGNKDIQLIATHAPNVQFIIIDSLTVLAPRNEQQLIDTIKTNAPNTAIIAILQSNKDGSHVGSQSLIHATDIICNVDNGIATARSRFNNSVETQWEIFPKNQASIRTLSTNSI